MMTTVDGTTLSSESGIGSRGEGRAERPLLFLGLLLAAATIVVGVLIAGPAMPIAASVALSIGALLLVAAGWILGGPRW